MMKDFFNRDLSGDARRMSGVAIAVCAVALAAASFTASTGTGESKTVERDADRLVPASTDTSEQASNRIAPDTESERQDRSKDFIVAGWLPFWDTDEGMRSVRDFPRALDEVSPFWYESRDDGQVASSPKPERPEIVKSLRALGQRILPTIRAFDATATSSIITDDKKRAFHIERIVELAVNRGYDGIDIDYESVRPEDRDAFSRFIRELGPALRARGKILVTTVYAKTSFPGSPGSSYGHDYQAVGEVSDRVRIMAYDQHYPGGPPGPVASVAWVERVLDYAVTKIPREKIILGIPAFGYDWPVAGGRAASVVHDDAAGLSLSHNAPVEWDEVAQSPFFRYDAGSGEHIVWFENNRSLQAKVGLARKFGVGGIVIWRLGREDKDFFRFLSQF